MASIEKDKGRFQGLQDHKVAFDQDKMWNKVKPREKKNRMFIWFFGLVVVMIAAAIIFNEIKDYESIAKPLVIESNENIVNEESLDIKSDGIVASKGSLLESDSVWNGTDNKQLSSLEVSVNAEIQQTNSIKKSTSKRVKSVGDQENKTVFNAETNKPVDVKNLKSELAIVLPSISAEAATINKQLIDKSNGGIGKLEKMETLNTNLVAQENFILKPVYQIQRLSIDPFKIEKKQFHFYEICSLPGVGRKPFLCRLGISAYIGYGLASKQLSGANNKYLNYRRSSEHELENLGAGFNISHSLNKWFYVTTGLGYNRIASKFNYQNSQVGSISDVDPTMLPPSIQGQKGIIKIVNNSTFYNNYHSLNIPLSLGYQYRFKKLLVGVEAGINYYIMQKYEGHLANDKLQLENLGEIPKNLNQIGYATSLVLGTEIFGRHTSISPTIMFYPKNSILRINEAYTTYSLRLGISF